MLLSRSYKLSIWLIYFRRRCIPHEWVCDKDFDCFGDDKSDEDETICQFKEKCLPNQSECAGAAGTGIVCIDTEKFCDGVFDCVNDEYTEYCGEKWAWFTSLCFFFFVLICILSRNRIFSHIKSSRR